MVAGGGGGAVAGVGAATLVAAAELCDAMLAIGVLGTGAAGLLARLHAGKRLLQQMEMGAPPLRSRPHSPGL